MVNLALPMVSVLLSKYALLDRSPRHLVKRRQVELETKRRQWGVTLQPTICHL